MATVSLDTLVKLARRRDALSISLYMPTHRAGSEKDQDRIRLKNLVRSACADLGAHGLRDADAERLCAPARALVDDDTFWRAASEGLAVFISEGEMQTMALDAPVHEQAIVGDRYCLRPLLTAHRGERRFFALTIDRGGCRLFKGDGASIRQLTLEGVPASLADELKFDQPEESLQYSSVPAPGAAAGGGRPTSAVFHGHGGEKDVDKNHVERYLRKVEAAVSKLVDCDSPAPLILLGVEYELAIYRSLNTCRALDDAQVAGSTAELTPHEIRLMSLEALSPRFEAAIGAALSELSDLGGSTLSERDVTRIVSAAAAGRVKTLFFDDSVGPFGTFDRDADKATVVCADAPRLLRETAGLEPAQGECGWDLVDIAAAETLLHGGEVHAFSGEGSPIRGVAAVLRY